MPSFPGWRAFLFPDAGLSEDGLVCELLELLPQQERVERDLVVRDPAHAELVEEPLPLLPVLLDEQVVRAPVAERRARVAVDVRHDEVHPVLRERVERDALDEDPPELLVDALIKAGGNMLKAARDLKSSYRIVNYKVKKYGIDPHQFVYKNRSL